MTGPEINLNSPNHVAVLARDVIDGDRVLASVVRVGSGKLAAVYHSDPYVACPQADKPGCLCPGHEALDAADRAKTLVVLYDGENWDYSCDVVPADDYVIIERRPEAEQPKKRRVPALARAGSGWDFLHNGRAVLVFRTGGQPNLWSARPYGGKTIVSHRSSRTEAARAAMHYLDGYASERTGYDVLAERLSL